MALKDDINSIGDTKCADDTDQTAAQDPAPLNPPTKTRIKCSEKVSKPARVDHVLEMTKDISSLEEDIRCSFPDISKQIRNDTLHSDWNIPTGNVAYNVSCEA